MLTSIVGVVGKYLVTHQSCYPVVTTVPKLLPAVGAKAPTLICGHTAIGGELTSAEIQVEENERVVTLWVFPRNLLYERENIK